MTDPRPKKALGQHWLDDSPSLDSMISAGQVNEGDNILEIGPGTGLLTDRLLAKKAKIQALEFDEHWAKELKQNYKTNDNVQVMHGDIRTFDLDSMPKDYKIVANIPYYLTANLLRKLVDTKNKPVVAAILIQKEVAHRITAEAGDASLISILAQLFYKTSLGPEVPAELFDPPPKVDSQVLILERHDKPVFPPTKELFQVIKAGFTQKRKKIKAGLSGGLHISKEKAVEMLDLANIDSNKRPQELTLEDWHRLSTTL